MPVTCEKRDGEWRVVEGKGGSIAKNSSGTSVDGGGHESEAACKRQARAINANQGG